MNLSECKELATKIVIAEATERKLHGTHTLETIARIEQRKHAMLRYVASQSDYQWWDRHFVHATASAAWRAIEREAMRPVPTALDNLIRRGAL
jgi:hypothetical protein